MYFNDSKCEWFRWHMTSNVPVEYLDCQSLLISVFVIFKYTHTYTHTHTDTCTYWRKVCRLPYGMYSMMRAIGSQTVHAPTSRTMLAWWSICFIKLISRSSSSRCDGKASPATRQSFPLLLLLLHTTILLLLWLLLFVSVHPGFFPGFTLHCVSKNFPPLACYNFDTWTDFDIFGQKCYR